MDIFSMFGNLLVAALWFFIWSIGQWATYMGEQGIQRKQNEAKFLGMLFGIGVFYSALALLAWFLPAPDSEWILIANLAVNGLVTWMIADIRNSVQRMYPVTASSAR